MIENIAGQKCLVPQVPALMLTSLLHTLKYVEFIIFLNYLYVSSYIISYTSLVLIVYAFLDLIDYYFN